MLNKVILLGNLGKDPELKDLGNEKQVCKFTLATSSGWGEKKETSWHNLVCWNKTAEVAAKYLRRGSRCYVEGRIQYREYEKDGVKKYFTEIVVNSLLLMGSKDEAKPDNGGGSGDTPF